MDGFELLLWRREHRVTQEQLAKELGVTRHTITNWERGKHRLPMKISSQLERVAITTRPKPLPEVPQWINSESAPHLFKTVMVGRTRATTPTQEHPYWLLGKEHPFCVGGTKWPYKVLESDDYKEALRKHRGEFTLPDRSE